MIYYKDVDERVVKASKYIIDNKSTIRETAVVFGVSKSTIHKDITNRLSNINPMLKKQVQKVLDYNKEQCTSRGGIATKLKYKSLKIS